MSTPNQKTKLMYLKKVHTTTVLRNWNVPVHYLPLSLRYERSVFVTTNAKGIINWKTTKVLSKQEVNGFSLDKIKVI